MDWSFMDGDDVVLRLRRENLWVTYYTRANPIEFHRSFSMRGTLVTSCSIAFPT